MKAEHFIPIWLTEKYPDTKELGDWTAEDVLEIMKAYADEQSREEAIIGQVKIKPECRETHGFLEAYSIAVRQIQKVYEMFATEVNHQKTFTIQLKIESKEEKK